MWYTDESNDGKSRGETEKKKGEGDATDNGKKEEESGLQAGVEQVGASPLAGRWVGRIRGLGQIGEISAASLGSGQHSEYISASA